MEGDKKDTITWFIDHGYPSIGWQGLDGETKFGKRQLKIPKSTHHTLYSRMSCIVDLNLHCAINPHLVCLQLTKEEEGDYLTCASSMIGGCELSSIPVKDIKHMTYPFPLSAYKSDEGPYTLHILH